MGQRDEDAPAGPITGEGTWSTTRARGWDLGGEAAASRYQETGVALLLGGSPLHPVTPRRIPPKVGQGHPPWPGYLPPWHDQSCGFRAWLAW